MVVDIEAELLDIEYVGVDLVVVVIDFGFVVAVELVAVPWGYLQVQVHLGRN